MKLYIFHPIVVYILVKSAQLLGYGGYETGLGGVFIVSFASVHVSIYIYLWGLQKTFETPWGKEVSVNICILFPDTLAKIMV